MHFTFINCIMKKKETAHRSPILSQKIAFMCVYIYIYICLSLSLSLSPPSPIGIQLYLFVSFTFSKHVRESDKLKCTMTHVLFEGTLYRNAWFTNQHTGVHVFLSNQYTWLIRWEWPRNHMKSLWNYLQHIVTNSMGPHLSGTQQEEPCNHAARIIPRFKPCPFPWHRSVDRKRHRNGRPLGALVKSKRIPKWHICVEVACGHFW